MGSSTRFGKPDEIVASQDSMAGGPSIPAGWNVLVRHYEECMAQHGATPRGVDWPNGDDLAARFGVMLEVLAETGERPRLLDLGCGPGLLLDYLAATSGVDRDPGLTTHVVTPASANVATTSSAHRVWTTASVMPKLRARPASRAA